MIEQITGIVESIVQPNISIRMGPLCLSLQVPRAHSITNGSQVTLFTQLCWNAETGPQLFGFITPLDRTIFMLATECSGIGPRLALALIEQLGPEAIVTALYEGNTKLLSSVSGIGTKKAEYMIVHLKQKAQKLITLGLINTTGSLSHLHEVDSALQSLNYSRPEIQRALDHIKHLSTADTPPTFDLLLRRALAYLTHKQ